METAPPELANPVLNESDAKEAESILNLVKEADTFRDIGEESAQPEPRVPEPGTAAATEAKGEVTPDNPEPKPEDTDRPRGPDGKFISKEPAAEVQPTTEPEPKAESNFEKAKKEQDRRDRSWKALDEEKATERARIQAEREQIERERQALAQERERPRTTPDGRFPYRSQEYVQAAKGLRAEARQLYRDGDFERAAEKDGLADNAEEAARGAYQYEHQVAAERQRTELVQKYNADVEKAFKDNVELQDEKHPIHEHLAELQKEPVFGAIENGFSKMVQVAKWKMEAGMASGLREENRKLKAALDDANKKVSLTPSSVTPPPQGKKSFEQMDVEQMGEELRRALPELNDMLIT